MCEDIPCIKACPTMPLDRRLTNINDADMGRPSSSTERLHRVSGPALQVCFNICPIRGEAITPSIEHNAALRGTRCSSPWCTTDACTGCGKCEEACILDEAAIKVLPRHLAQGKLASPVPVGLGPEQQAGGALVHARHRASLRPAGGHALRTMARA